MLSHFFLSLAPLFSPWQGSQAAPQRDSNKSAEIDWHSGSFESALRSGQKNGRPLVVYFWMDGSQHCAQLFQDTLQTQKAAEVLAPRIAFSAKATDANGARLVKRFGIRTLPTLLFLDAKGIPEEALPGFVSLASFVPEVLRIDAGRDTVGDLRKRLTTSPDDLGLRFQLADKLQYVGQREEAERLLASIRRDDPKGKSVIGAQLALNDIIDEITMNASDLSDPGTYDLRKLYRHLPRIQPKPVAYQGWQWVATIEGQRGKRDQQRKAWMQAIAYADTAQEMSYGREVVRALFDMREELNKKEKLFALEVAQRTAGRAEELHALEDPPADLLVEGYQEDPEAFVAGYLDGLACAYYLNGKRKKAIQTVQRSLQLDPKSPDHQGWLDHFVERRP